MKRLLLAVCVLVALTLCVVSPTSAAGLNDLAPDNVAAGVTFQGGDWNAVLTASGDVTTVKMSWERFNFKLEQPIQYDIMLIGDLDQQNLALGLSAPILPALNAIGLQPSSGFANFLRKVYVGAAGWKNKDSGAPEGGVYVVLKAWVTTF